ncbi:MAG: ribosomal RNA small subunit methyltransferase A [Deltaproteobacteria bacterium]|nr:ribosomal RNA small subunit methyltransferase A [Deltaproteobacteria bacterium]
MSPPNLRPLRTAERRAARAGAALTAIGVRPRKSRGQNFLVQVAVANRIVDAAHVGPEDRVLEIGPGLGILSERIAAHRLSKLTLVELEPSLATQLEQRFAGDRRVRIVNADFMKADFAALCERAPSKVIGNLPFNAAAAILSRLCTHRAGISRMVLMFQREVAERIRARAGDPSYGALTVFTALYFKVESHFRVSAGNFHPRPRIDAEVLVFEPQPRPIFDAEEESAVLETIRAAFSAPRKTLRNSIAHALRLDPGPIDETLRAAAIDPGVRAERLPSPDFVRLARHLRPLLAGSNA